MNLATVNVLTFTANGLFSLERAWDLCHWNSFLLNCMPNDEILFRRGTKINGLYAVVDESVVLVQVLNNSMRIEQLTCALFPHFQILNFYESSSLRFSYARQMY